MKRRFRIRANTFSFVTTIHSIALSFNRSKKPNDSGAISDSITRYVILLSAGIELRKQKALDNPVLAKLDVNCVNNLGTFTLQAKWIKRNNAIFTGHRI